MYHALLPLISTSFPPLQLEVDGEGEGGGSKALFLEKVRQSNAACQSGDFETAVALYTEAIALDPHNHILYSNRSAAHIKLAKFAHALQDATKARELNPKWPKVSVMCVCVVGRGLVCVCVPGISFRSILCLYFSLFCFVFVVQLVVLCVCLCVSVCRGLCLCFSSGVCVSLCCSLSQVWSTVCIRA